MDVPLPPDASPPAPAIPSIDAGVAGLQFDKADFGTGRAALACAACETPIAGEYYDVSGKTLCPACKAKVEAALGGSPGAEGFFRALGGGIAGGAAGALVFGTFLFYGVQWSLIAIAVGWLVGKGIQWGTRGRGGVVYQILAVVLTYLAIGASYVVPAVVQQSEASGLAVVAVAIGLVVVPVLVAKDSILSGIIMAIGLYEAWKMNKRVPFVITGPFHAAFRPSAAAPGA